jgi:hypothetical protein
MISGRGLGEGVGVRMTDVGCLLPVGTPTLELRRERSPE